MKSKILYRMKHFVKFFKIKKSFPWYSFGGAEPSRSAGVLGFAIAPASDLASQRLDRVSYLLVSTPSGELSFD
jgi:hypothetical protein